MKEISMTYMMSHTTALCIVVPTVLLIHFNVRGAYSKNVKSQVG